MAAQRCFEDLGTPLAEVTFCVVDLETTGGSAAASAITEIGALKVRRGERAGTFHTLVNPGCSVPAFIRLLTGISDDMLIEAPPIETVLPSFLEFARNTVLVAHNARFDVGFLNAALTAAEYPPLDHRVLDTAVLARKILAGEVPNNRLATLVRHLRCPHEPCHRAFADVLATTDVLHYLIERVAGFGITTLEDLVAFSRTRVDGTFSKLRLTESLPRGPGIYRFVGAGGKTLYVGKSSDLRSRVRSYFYGDPRRKIRDLLRQTQDIRTESYASMLEAEVAEARVIAAERPPHNRAGKRSGVWYLKVTTRARRPKIAPTRTPKEDGAVYMGPWPSLRTVRALVDAMRDAFKIHRCSEPARCRGCAFAELGTCVGHDERRHRAEVRAAVTAIVMAPDEVLGRVWIRMLRLAQAERYEEAAETRERGAVLEAAIARDLETTALARAGDVVVATGGRALLIRAGRLAAAVDLGDGDAVARLLSVAAPYQAGSFLSPAVARESRIVLAWLKRHADEVRLLHVEGAWVMPARARPRFSFQSREPTGR